MTIGEELQAKQRPCWTALGDRREPRGCTLDPASKILDLLEAACGASTDDGKRQHTCGPDCLCTFKIIQVEGNFAPHDAGANLRSTRPLVAVRF